MKGPLPGVCAFVIWFLALSGCNLDGSQIFAPELGPSVNGRTVTYASNHKFSLELHVLADAGYFWHCTISDTTVVCLDSTVLRPSSGNWNMAGGMDLETFHFRTLEAGTCSVVLDERRPWLPDAQPINSVRFNVVVLP